MNALFESSLYFGVFISLAAYGVGVWLKKMTGWSLMNPLFVAIVLVIASISLLGISYDTYNRGAHIITYLLTPSTICLAVPLYQHQKRKSGFGKGNAPLCDSDDSEHHLYLDYQYFRPICDCIFNRHSGKRPLCRVQ